jgi:hypothetical protein
MASGSTAVSCHYHVIAMKLDYLQNLLGAVHRYTEVETNNSILDEQGVEQFPTSIYFLYAVYRNLGCAS